MRRIGTRIDLLGVVILCLAIVGAVALLLAGCGGQATQTTASPTTTTGLSSASSEGPATTGSSTGGSGSTSTEASATTELPLQPEVNPPGDIPDNQVFITYKPLAAFTVKVPEGWARTENGSTASFTDKLNTIVLTWSNATAAPTEADIKATDIPALQKSEKAFELVSVATKKLPAGDAVLVTYRENSEPNSVTGKQYRLDVLRFTLFNAGLRLDITLLSPVGADNVDPWNIVTKSVTWK